jgi:hypothetical protein
MHHPGAHEKCYELILLTNPTYRPNVAASTLCIVRIAGATS